MATQITSIDIYNNNIVSVTKGKNEMGILANINDFQVVEDATQNDLLQVLLSEIHSINVDCNVGSDTKKQLELKPLQKSAYQVRMFAVPNGPLGISVASTPHDSSLGLKIIDVDDFVYFAPGDIIASVNGVLLHKLTPEFAVSIFSKSTERHLTVVRGFDVNEDDTAWPAENERNNLTHTKERYISGPDAHFLIRNSPYYSFIKKMRTKFIEDI